MNLTRRHWPAWALAFALAAAATPSFAQGAAAEVPHNVVTQGATTKIGELAGYDLNKIDAALIAKAANMGDEIAKDIYERAGEALGIAISNTLVTIDAHKIVIGGGVAQAGDLLLDPIRRTIKKRVFIMPLDEVEVALAELGGNAGIIGAAAFAASQVEGE
jgi:glucokinase